MSQVISLAVIMSSLSIYNICRHAVEAKIQKVQFTRCLNKLLRLFSNVLLEDVKDMKKLALTASVNLPYKISCLPHLHVRRMHNLQIAWSLGQPAIHVTKFPFKLKPENQVFQSSAVVYFCIWYFDVSGMLLLFQHISS